MLFFVSIFVLHIFEITYRKPTSFLFSPLLCWVSPMGYLSWFDHISALNVAELANMRQAVVISNCDKIDLR